MRRYELSNQQWSVVESFFPPTHSGHAGRPWCDHRSILNGILWELHTGAAWRDVPERYGPWQTVYDRFRRYQRDGTWNQIVETLLNQLRDQGQQDPDTWMLDATILRATRDAAGAGHDSQAVMVGSDRTQLSEPQDHALGRSRGGFGTKVDLIVESHGIPIALYVHPGQEHESRTFETTMGRSTQRHAPGRRKWPQRLIADKAYNNLRIRGWLKRRGIAAVIPKQQNQVQDPRFDREAYRQRHVIEQTIGWFKLHRRLATRYDKLAVSFLAFWTVAWIMLLIKYLLSDTASTSEGVIPENE